MPKKTITKKTKENPISKHKLAPDETEKVRSILSEICLIPVAPQSICKKAGQIMDKIEKSIDLTKEDSTELGQYYLSINGTQTHVLLAETVREERDRTLIMEYADDLIKEFECTKTHERALCEVVASHYMAVMKASRNMNNFQNLETLSEIKNTYYAIVSKELERQQRMYIHAFQALQALKSPQMNITFKANNAFIAQNQQFNNNPSQLGENQ